LVPPLEVVQVVAIVEVDGVEIKALEYFRQPCDEVQIEVRLGLEIPDGTVGEELSLGEDVQ